MSDIPESAPKHCPGTESQQAGKSQPCQGCPNQGVCASGVSKAPDPDLPLLQENLSSIAYKLLVLSGKGGVGKSSFSAQLAYWLSEDETQQIGLLDLDITGPSIPLMMGCTQEKVHSSASGWSPVYVRDNLAVMSSGFLLEDEGSAIIWRGPKKNALIKQFLKDVHWQALDILIIDTPPGTSDEHLTITQYLKNEHYGAVIITGPQEISLQDVRKEIDFCKKLKIPILGIVENMSLFSCPNCKKTSKIFHSSEGSGASFMAYSLGLPFLGSLPLDSNIAKSCDSGVPFYENEQSLSIFKSVFQEIIQKLLLQINNQQPQI